MALVVETAAAAPEKRLFIAGISPSLSVDDLAKRLGSYGQLTSELQLNHKNAETTGTFAHCNIQLEASQWSRLKRLSGTVLKGSKLRIEEAKQDWLERKVNDDRRPNPVIPNPRKRVLPGTIVARESKRVKRGELVKDGDITQKSRRQGWIKGRYGRALAVLKRENEPALKRNPDALSRLWGSAHPRPEQLTYRYDDEEDEWYDRGGRVIEETEVTKKLRPVELQEHGCVEIWDESDNDMPMAAEEYTGNSDTATNSQIVEDNDIDEQLADERSVALGLLESMFPTSEKGADTGTSAALQRQEKRKSRDTLKIVARFDPDAMSTTSDSVLSLDEATSLTQFHDSDDKIHLPISAEDDDTPKSSTAAEDTLVPALQEASKESCINFQGLSQVFEHSKQGEQPFMLFQPEPSDTLGSDGTTLEPEKDDNIDVHPDRVNLKSQPHATESEISNTNFTAIARDRGFRQVGHPKPRSGLISLFRSAQQANSVPFPSLLDCVDRTSEAWHEIWRERTRLFKRRNREALKFIRKKSSRQLR